MILGCIADDFTGASDLANTLARGGMATTLYVGTPATAPDCEAGVVALKSRSVPAPDAVRQSLAALAWLQAQGCRQFLFKYCSTFDSTPAGNIGPVAMALLNALDAPFAVVCPAFPAAGRKMFQGHLFVGDRLLSESGMERHPLTPMTDPDIRRWLGRQVPGPVGLVPLDVVHQGASALTAAIAASACRLVVVDAVAAADLYTIGAAVAGHRLVTGGSGVALGLPDNFRAAGLLGGAAPPFVGVPGPGLVLSGSCSATSVGQVAAYRAAGYPALALDPASVLDGSQTPDTVLTWLLSHRTDGPMVYSTAAADSVATTQSTHGRDRVAAAIEAVFAGIARRAVEAGFRRVVVGGGETAGAVVSALGLTALSIGPEIAPGVPALAADGGLRLALKSGNFGGTAFHADAMAALG